jgi:hypothetical protein
MTVKLLLGSLSIITRPIGGGRTLAWYAQRRLGRA